MLTLLAVVFAILIIGLFFELVIKCGEIIGYIFGLILIVGGGLAFLGWFDDKFIAPLGVLGDLLVIGLVIFGVVKIARKMYMKIRDYLMRVKISVQNERDKAVANYENKR